MYSTRLACSYSNQNVGRSDLRGPACRVWQDALWLCIGAVHRKRLSELMDVPYDVWRSAGSGWRDGLHWLEEIEAWSRAYDEVNTVPDKCNKILARVTISIALINVPCLLQGVAKQVVAALLDQRIRRAVMYVHLIPL